MVPAVGRVAGHARVGAGVHPVALQALAVGVGDHPASGGQAAVVVCEVDVAGGGVDVAAAHDVAAGRGVGPPAGVGGVDQAGAGHGSALHPVALEALAVGGGHEPARHHEPAVVVGPEHVVAVAEGPAGHVALRGGPVVPAVMGVPHHGGVAPGVHPVALQALAVGVGDHPASGGQAAVVVCEVDVAGGGVDVAAAHDVAAGRGVGPPAGVGGVDQAGAGHHAVNAEPVALQAVVHVGVVDQPPGVERSVIAVVAHRPVGRDVPAALGRGRGGRRGGGLQRVGAIARGGPALGGPGGGGGGVGGGRRGLRPRPGLLACARGAEVGLGLGQRGLGPGGLGGRLLVGPCGGGHRDRGGERHGNGDGADLR